MRKTLTTLLLLIIFLLNLNLVFAQEEIKINADPHSTESANVDYALPYPGLLSDNPLYFFKTVRDSFTRFFISDPFKKAQYDLLQADKNLNTGYYLALKNTGKDKLILVAVTKGENSFENVIQEVLQTKEQGTDVSDFLDKMIISSQKHQEILTDIKTRVSLQNREVLGKQLERVQDFRELVNKIKSR